MMWLLQVTDFACVDKSGMLNVMDIEKGLPFF
jgi:hypothetical protein